MLCRYACCEKDKATDSIGSIINSYGVIACRTSAAAQTFDQASVQTHQPGSLESVSSASAVLPVHMLKIS